MSETLTPPDVPGTEARPVDAGAKIGHVHLKVADVERALRLLSRRARLPIDPALSGRRVRLGRRLSPPYRAQHMGERGRPPPPRSTTGLFHLAIVYPTRAALADALQRLIAANIPLDGASDHGVSEALYLRDPDENGVELYWDRPETRMAAHARWPARNAYAPAEPGRSSQRGGTNKLILRQDTRWRVDRRAITPALHGAVLYLADLVHGVGHPNPTADQNRENCED